ncbi:hypothetical protein PT7_2324 [Pusillimonas sp. T7-7]|uniref:hypothetical protein n=1 Tax=Pusillimonas sp. (strain T7-7) TaxID=1007105 RepID=UPI00020856EB|nr:hypothetical protein [Pusillimonas sp. T7-7]AEC20864.1 hypothetical protein PT7_2324 [Pusillimonas sp. T7-7]
MKKTDLEKNKALKLMGKMKQAPVPGRFAGDAESQPLDRRAQRKLDQAQGLVSFPVKIKQTLVEEIRRQADERGASTNEVIGELLEQGLASATKE